MIRVDGNKIIIEIENEVPIDSVKALQNGIIRMIQLSDLEGNDEAIYWSMELLSAMMLSEAQMKTALVK